MEENLTAEMNKQDNSKTLLHNKYLIVGVILVVIILIGLMLTLISKASKSERPGMANNEMGDRPNEVGRFAAPPNGQDFQYFEANICPHSILEENGQYAAVYLEKDYLVTDENASWIMQNCVGETDGV